MVSIHALLAECDSFLFDFPHPQGGFNPRTPCGVRLPGTSRRLPRTKFQSTHSLRSATRVELLVGCQVAVSIHALLAECDTKNVPSEIPSMRFNPRTPCGVRPGSERPAGYLQMFQSTHSLRSATNDFRMNIRQPAVSIHALLAECDGGGRRTFPGLLCFNPRTPCGVRPASLVRMTPTPQFQSTHSLRSATQGGKWLFALSTVSIHALLAECDTTRRPQNHGIMSFNPRTPCGVRLL